MIEPETQRGVLNDWDLSRIHTATGVEHCGGKGTGTIPFMAMDLLTPEYFGGSKAPLYRHDLEGFIWILPWVFLQYDGPKFAVEQLRWGTDNYHDCHIEKAKMLVVGNIETYTPTASWKHEWQLAECLLMCMWLVIENSEQAKRHLTTNRQRTVLERRREKEEGQTSYPREELLCGALTEEQIKEIKRTRELYYESSRGKDIDVEKHELAPDEVYNRFCQHLNGKGINVYPELATLLSWDPM